MTVVRKALSSVTRPLVAPTQRRTFIDWMTNYPDRVRLVA